MEPTAQIGAYRVTKVLATGETSCILAAIAEGPGGFAQPVALKGLYGDAARSHEVQREFEHEARAAASVYHPHLVQVHAFIEDRGRNFLAMELVRGWSTRALTATLALTRRRVAFEIAVAVVRDAARGAHALHDVGMLHRDLSPDNLLISAAGCVKIVDFGAASWELAARGSARPRPPRNLTYAAPEISLGLDLDRPSDVYSLGAVLHELCSTALPQGSSSWPRRRGANDGAAVLLDEALPDGLGAVLERALRHAPTERFASAADLAEALDDIAAHHGWRTTPALIGEYMAQTFTSRGRLSRSRRRPASETGTTRVRLRRVGN